jgi:hypothetical protein
MAGSSGQVLRRRAFTHSGQESDSRTSRPLSRNCLVRPFRHSRGSLDQGCGHRHFLELQPHLPVTPNRIKSKLINTLKLDAALWQRHARINRPHAQCSPLRKHLHFRPSVVSALGCPPSITTVR